MRFQGRYPKKYGGILLAFILIWSGRPGHAVPIAGRTIGGTVSGLVMSGITLLNNGKDSITISASGTFVFPQPLPDSSPYDVTIQTQPLELRCIVLNGTGTVRGAPVTNVVVTCPMAFKNSLLWMRCSQGQKWNPARGDCTGTGVANSYGAERLRYCPHNDNSCNGGSNTGPLTDASAVFASCNRLNADGGMFGITSWRVPTKDELRSLVMCSDGTATPLNDYGTDPYRCGFKNRNYVNGSYRAPTLDSRLFPNSMSLEYWSATSAEKQASSAWSTAFQNGWTSTSVKSGQSYLRCVAQP